MKVGDYIFSWQHAWIGDENGKFTGYVGLSRCTISIAGESTHSSFDGVEKHPAMQMVGTGIAKKSDKDQFNKEKARRISLSRALLMTFPGHEQKSFRRSIWEVYRTTSKVPKWKNKASLETRQTPSRDPIFMSNLRRDFNQEE